MSEAEPLIPERPRAAEPAPPARAAPRAGRLVCRWARHLDDVRAAQRLRHQVFAGEMGATLSPPPGTPAGLDVDAFDEHCEHLVVSTVDSDGAPGEVVGTYRVLTPAGARRAGLLYSETEFDLSPLASLRGDMAELGRSCTAPQWRSGGVILMLWSSLADFMDRNGLRRVVGCASVPMRDGGHVAASLWQRLRETHLVEPGLRVHPRLPLPVEQLDGSLPAELPPLVKGYLRCGARVLGAPAWDPDFGVADLPLLLDLQDLPAAYRNRFIGG